MSLESVFSVFTMIAFATGYTVAYRGLIHGFARLAKGMIALSERVPRHVSGPLIPHI